MIVQRLSVGVAALALAACVPAEAFAQGCAMCQTYIAGVNDPLAQGLNWSILLLLSAPYALFSTVGGWLLYTHWRAHDRRSIPQILRFAPINKETVQ